MSPRTESGLPACEFSIPNLALKLDELIPSEIGAISPIVDKLMRLIKESACAPGREFVVETALREALANAILHGNRQDPRKKVRICCACQAGRGIIIVVRDEGKGFDPARVPSPLMGKNIYSEHGRGIYLINLLMDEVRFERGGTEIHMRKG
jgi:serine/threonine-protein kinase RsbW